MNLFKSRESDKSREGRNNTTSTTLKTIRNLGCATLLLATMVACKPNLKKMSLPELQAYLCDLTSRINDGADVQGLIAGENNIGVDEDNGKDREQVNRIFKGTNNRSEANTIRFNDAIDEMARVEKEIDRRIANGENASNRRYMDTAAFENARRIINKQQEYRKKKGF